MVRLVALIFPLVAMISSMPTASVAVAGIQAGDVAIASSIAPDVAPASPDVIALADAEDVMTPMEQALLALTNVDRGTNAVAPLQFDPELLAIARERAAEQMSMSDLTHTDAQGQLVFQELVDRQGLAYRLIGENLAKVPGLDAGVAARAEVALMNSPTHRANILEPIFDRVAIGSVVDSSGNTLFAEIYRAAN
ncbi:MAG: hypothetical protein QOF51_3869 [Chloroflexota bacterium]|nr:hypothetical protein [Chloroflexota bacterium]